MIFFTIGLKTSMKKYKIPAILCDIDGLLLRGVKPLPRVLATLKALRLPITSLYKNPDLPSKQLPLVLLTNGGAALPANKIIKYNQYFELNDDFSKFQTKNVVLNYSPLTEALPEMKEKLWVISGMGCIEEIASFCGFHNTITLSNFINLREQSKRDNYNKFGKLYENIAGFMILDDIYDWDLNLNVILDLIARKQKDFPIVFVHNDTSYPDEFPLDRMCLGTFRVILSELSKKIINADPNLIFYGKPTEKTFNYTKSFIKKNWPEFEISNFYMLGDNPNTDILGGNRSQMETILVRTGVYSENNKNKYVDESMKPKHLVEDFFEAINLISKKEGFYI